MSRLKRLIHAIHERSLWQILVVYLGVSWGVLEAADLFAQRLGLANWLFWVALGLLVVGLVVLLVLAFLPEPAVSPTEPHELHLAGHRRRQLLTWRRAATVFVMALAAWGVVATGWLVLHARDAATPSEAKSVAVLPFANIGGDPEDEYYSDGITGEIIVHLSKIADLKVISRTSVMQYKNTQKDVRQIGEELEVAAVLEGELQRAGDRLRVNAQLIDARSEGHLWSEQYDREMTDVFVIQSDVAKQIAAALKATLTPSEEERIALKPTENLQAYDYYLRGNEYFNRGIGQENYRLAMELYENAVQLDPEFALAYAGISRVHTWYYWERWDRSEGRAAMAKATAEKALDIAPDLAEAHMAMGLYYYRCELDHEQATEELNIALQGQPNHSELLYVLSAIQRRQGDWVQAIASGERSLSGDPRSAVKAHSLAASYALMRDYELAEETYNRAITLNPDWTTPYYWKQRMYIWQGNTSKARSVVRPTRGVGAESLYVPFMIEAIDRNFQNALDSIAVVPVDFIEAQFSSRPKFLYYALVHDLMESPLAEVYYDSARVSLEARLQERPDDAALHSSLGVAYAGLGRKEDAISEGELGVRLLPVEKDAVVGPIRVEELVGIYTMVGQHEAAIERLDYLLSIPSMVSTGLLRVSPFYDPLRDYPRFQALLTKYE